MQTVILLVELVRSRPAVVFWTAALAQALIWWLLSVALYSAPPDGIAEVLAFGHEFERGTDLGPPLAFWVAEIVYRAAGFPGLYFLAQLCVLVALWAVFTLGCAVVGPRHAALAALMTACGTVFALQAADFGPGVLALPLWALALLHGWRAVGEQRRPYWLAVGLEIGLLLMTTYAGFALLAALLGFAAATARGRAQLLTVEPWIGGIVAIAVLFPHLIWLDQVGGVGFAAPWMILENLANWGRLVAMLIVGHAGMLILVAIVALGALRRGAAPELVREPLDADARRYVLLMAIAPMLGVVLLTAFGSSPRTYVVPPLVLLTGLAVVTLAPDRIPIGPQRLAACALALLLLVPPFAVGGAIALAPWVFPVELSVAWPARDIGRFFSESFARRAGRPLAIVAGDPQLAALVAAAAPERPSLLLDATPQRTPWITPRDVELKGALVVWRATDIRGTPPAPLQARFAELAPEVPHQFRRRFEGRMAPLRIGWAVIMPRAPDAGRAR